MYNDDMKKVAIRLDTYSLNTRHRSGVTYYTDLLKKALESNDDIDLSVPETTPLAARIISKLNSYGLAPKYDASFPEVDLTIFPNFAMFPTKRSRLSATVIHDLTYLYYPELVETKNLAHLQRVVPRSIEQADFILTVSESVKAELVKEFNLDPNDCVVTPISPDEVFFAPVEASRIDFVKDKYGINKTKKIIYFIGNFEPRKNLKNLIEAYRQLPPDTKNSYSLVLAGGKGWNSEETAQALEKAQQNGEDVTHIGYVDQQDSPALYQVAALFVMPSLYEGFGMPVLESMASGTPVLASDIPVLREVGGQHASYTDTQDVEAFSSALSEALSAPVTSPDELRRHARQYSWSENVKKIINKVRSLE